ncbi:MAG: hypothetical protein ACR2QW_16000, partial [bacterium]
MTILGLILVLSSSCVQLKFVKNSGDVRTKQNGVSIKIASSYILIENKEGKLISVTYTSAMLVEFETKIEKKIFLGYPRFSRSKFGDPPTIIVREIDQNYFPEEDRWVLNKKGYYFI